MHRASKVAVVFIILFLALMAGCGSSSNNNKTQSISVSIAQGASTSIDVGLTKSLTANVAGDSKNSGVTWTMSGSGTLSGQTTTSVTYNAPTSGANATATVTATSVSDPSKIASIAITVNTTPSIATTPTPSAAINGTAYSFAVPESGGTSPFTWSISSGALPAGLSFDSTGKISGTPNANATQSPYAFTVKVTDNAGASATQSYSLTVNNPAAPVIASAQPPAGTNGTTYAPFTFAVASGGLAPFTWSESGALPAGLTFSAAGVLSGTPRASGSFPITVSVQDSSNPKQIASVSVTIQINNPPAPTITTTTLPAGSVGTAYSQTIQATGGLAPFTWSVSSGTPPGGLSLAGSNTNSVNLSGTPTTQQSGIQFTVQVQDSLGQTATQTYTMSIEAQPIVVTISNKIDKIQAGASAVTFTAVVQGDTQGVTWTLTAAGVGACSPSCGTLSNISSTSVTYTPPATVLSAPNNAPTLTATSVTDNTKSDTDSFTIVAVTASCSPQGSEATLSGQYAFSLSGFNANGFLAVVGSFTADGTGKITAGEADTNGTLGTVHGVITASASSYSVGSDGRGCAVIALPFGTFITRISTGLPNGGVATKGHIIEWETGNTAYVASGQLLKQTPSAFTSGVSSAYAFLTPGADGAGQPFASIGSLTASGGNFSGFTVDSNDSGTVTSASGGTGTYTSFDANGRSVGNVSIPAQMTSTFAMYMVNASDLLVISLDTPGQNPVDCGEVRSQSGTFSNASLNGTSVLYLSGSDDPSLAVADVGTLVTTGSGTFTANITEDRQGTLTSNTETGTYAVGSNGRTVITQQGKTGAPIIYLTGPNAGFIMSSGNSVSTGEVLVQSGAPFTISSPNGTYFAGVTRTVRQSQEAAVETFTLASGTVTGVGDYIGTQEDLADKTFTDTYTITGSGGTNSSGNPTFSTGYLINNSKFVMIDSVNSPYPTVTAAER